MSDTGMLSASSFEADVAVVGAGPAGIAAACRASAAGARVVVIDAGLAAGGQIWRHPPMGRPPREARRWTRRFERSGAWLLGESSVFDAAPGIVHAVRRGQRLTVRAPRMVLATGARELFLPFPGWDLPGVLGVGGAQALLKSGASFAGLRTVVAGSGPLLLPVAASLASAEAEVLGVAEQASAEALGRFAAGLWREPGKVLAAARYRLGFRGASLRTGTWVTAVRGVGRVEEVDLTDGSRVWTLPCDALACGYGLVPSLELGRWLGCEVAAGSLRVDGNQATTVEGVWAAGEPTGIAGVESALAEGEVAGLAATGSAVPKALRRRQAHGRRFAARLAEAFALRPELRSLASEDTVVCRCEDVRWKELSAFSSRRAAKLGSRLGMGACQGRVCGAATSWLLGWEEDTVRAPLLPVPLRCLVGEGGAE